MGRTARPRERLTRERIVEAALTLADREGIEAVSMRRLGRALGVEGMALYRHVPNRAAILDGIAEVVLAEIQIPAAGDWRDGVRELADELRRVALAHPHVLPLWAIRPVRSQAGLRPVEGTLTILREAGLNDDETVGAFWSLLAYTAGALLTEVAFNLGLSDAPTSWSRNDLDALPVGEFPIVRSLAGPLSTSDWAGEYRRGVETFLAGIEVRQSVAARGSRAG